MGKNILCFLLKGRFVFRAFKNGKWQAPTLFFKRFLAARWRMCYSRAGSKISSEWWWKLGSLEYTLGWIWQRWWWFGGGWAKVKSQVSSLHFVVQILGGKQYCDFLQEKSKNFPSRLHWHVSQWQRCTSKRESGGNFVTWTVWRVHSQAYMGTILDHAWVVWYASCF